MNNSPKSPISPNAKVAILLCTYNGERYLQEQLNSFDEQTHRNWIVHASDDGSTDDTLMLLDTYKKKRPDERLFIHEGPKAGFAANFLSLVYNDTIQADYYAYSDQDDIWEAEKLTRALQRLITIPSNIPALYCSRTCYISEEGKILSLSMLFKKLPCFSNALVQNIAGGNTMVFNQAARDLLTNTSPPMTIPSHDWWTYLMITACGGNVFYDPYPSVRYRQHRGNQIGANVSLIAKASRAKGLLAGDFKKLINQNIKALSSVRNVITKKNIRILDCFIAARQQFLFRRMYNFYRLGICRQTCMGNIGLFVGGILNVL